MSILSRMLRIINEWGFSANRRADDEKIDAIGAATAEPAGPSLAWQWKLFCAQSES